MNVISNLQIIAEKIREGVIVGTYSAQSGHPGGSLSICDLLAVLYFHEMNIDPNKRDDENRDRLVLSKGHAAPAYYAALALRGYFDLSELNKLRQIDSFLQGHPCMVKVPGVDMSSGSLGQGLSAANGMALSAKYKEKTYRVYCIIGDGEMEEGQIWEAIMSAAHYKLGNLTLFIDSNGLQIDGKVRDVMNTSPIDEKLKAFGWYVCETDGNSIEELLTAISSLPADRGVPKAIICRCIKGKGVSYMENQVGWHGTAPDKNQYEQAINEINQRIKEYERLYEI